MGDSVGAILAYDALCLDAHVRRASSEGSINDEAHSNVGSTSNISYEGEFSTANRSAFGRLNFQIFQRRFRPQLPVGGTPAHAEQAETLLGQLGLLR